MVLLRSSIRISAPNSVSNKPPPGWPTINIVIRPERPSDVAAIDAVTVAAFLEAPHTGYNEQLIVKALRDDSALSISLVAEIDGVVVGHVATSSVAISDGTSGWLGLGPISVLPELQREGIGSRLMRALMTLMESNGYGGCVLLGDPAFYSRFGFEPQAGLVLPDVPPEYFLAVAFIAPMPIGTVTYHAAFSLPAGIPSRH